jgi:hypothetical protein
MAIGTATIASTAVASSNERQFQHLFPYVIPFECNLDLDTIGAGLSAAGVVTVTGAELGDFVLVAIEGAGAADGFLVSAQVTDSNEVTIIVTDGTAATNTALAGNPRVRGIVLGTLDGLWDNVASY